MVNIVSNLWVFFVFKYNLILSCSVFLSNSSLQTRNFSKFWDYYWLWLSMMWDFERLFYHQVVRFHIQFCIYTNIHPDDFHKVQFLSCRSLSLRRTRRYRYTVHLYRSGNLKNEIKKKEKFSWVTFVAITNERSNSILTVTEFSAFLFYCTCVISDLFMNSEYFI